MFPHQLTGEAAQGPGSTGADATLLLQAERMASYALLAETAKALETGQVVKSEEKWWAMQGLNLRPHPCEGCALPLS